MAVSEAAMVTFAGVALQGAQDGTLELGPDLSTILQAAQCQDEQHYNALLAAGAAPVDVDFTMPDQALGDRTYFLITLLELKSIGVAGYMALTREWARQSDLDQVEVAYQMGVVEAQHQSLCHALVGVTPANDRAFARWLFAESSESLAALTTLGLLDGSGASASFPGPLDRVCRGVFGLTPETTTAMTLPRS